MNSEVTTKMRELSMYERKVLAERIGKKVAYVNSLIYHKDKNPSPQMANAIHKASKGLLNRELMCPHIDWKTWG